MIARKLYILTVDGYIRESFTTLPLLWGYLSQNRLNVDFTCTLLERDLERTERFDFQCNGSGCSIRLDYPNRGISVLEWMR